MIISASEILERYAAGEREFRENEFDFYDVTLQEVDLSGVNSSSAHIDGSYFSAIDLENVNLSGAEIRNTNFSFVNLKNANLSNAAIVNVDLREVNLDNANLKNTLLHCVNLFGTVLTEIQINDAHKRGSNLIINTRAIEESDMEVFHKLQAYHSAITFPSEELNSTCPFIWQIPGKDNIEIEDILKLGSYSSKTLYKVSDISYFRYQDNSKEPEENKRYNTLLEMLRDELLDTKIFWIEEYDDSDPSYSYSSP
jgi:Pentapeptide repeats (9 copies)